ncbi:CheA signal transduction histidine kinase [Scytonema sp. HK-05]|uniref:hybrid sensor histidine kinase/response regulator n=1 Tax=Scytonema sp. HK-05 TaxID=1137095 RepID=UPI0009377B02|nr:hybrid sensor histidine kinase/response regulator [Scytonema sp. HK-05]OKH55349.1 hybrid sensor histidine kinase/response regulator [Scytonema sp. HK-05]BAY42790.1 CheA signal transduction histidine kinase [Scytonema sp. HK-05]
MTNDPSIYEQSYRYFLQEAPELLQVIEQELFSLRENFSINKVYTLMRATHTLKGAAASVGLETINTVAHTLEDIFRAICKPDLSIDQEIEALLFKAYECLCLPLTTELTGGLVNDTEVLDQSAAIFAELQEKLGDCFSHEDHIPSSEELGFDLTQSIFEVGVTQGLDQLATAIATGDPEQIATTLRTKAEVFLGLAESLNLPGFKAIAQAVLAGLDNYPEQAVVIARVALANFQEARTAVLNGDRSQGGQPSLALQQLGGLLHNSPQDSQDSLIDAQKSVTQTTLDTELHSEEPAANEQRTNEPDLSSSPHLFISPPPQSSISSSTRTVRVNVEHLEQLNYLIGELLTNQNRQFLQNEQLSATVRVLVTKLIQHQQLLNQLQDLSDCQFSVPEQEWLVGNGQDNGRFDSLELFQSLIGVHTVNPLPSYKHHILPRPVYSTQIKTSITTRSKEFHNLVQSLLEDAVQLGEATDAIEMFARQSQESLEKQRRLLTNTRDSLMEARMLPLGHLFERFPRILHQLEVIHKKQVTLNFRGNDALVDKAVVEKLYDPLLHLLRNAFDHGIELPTSRQKRGKPEKGEIEICAYHQGRYLVIEVRDDGHGLDFEKIRAKAVECQLVSPEQARSLNEAQLTELIFEPGFSTASSVNELSGRGIGLDVVRTHLQTIRGSVAVYSQPNQGTMFRLQIPLGLTIANLLLCEAGNQTYALFVNSIEEILIPTAQQIRSWEGGKVLQWGKGAAMKLIPIYQLTKALNYSSSVTQPSVFKTKHSRSKEQGMPVILIRCQDKLFGLEVDQLIGDQELVIRPLGAMIVPPRYIYGSCILADGRLTLVLDGSTLMESLSEQQTDHRTNSSLASSTPVILTSRIEQPRLLSSARATLPESPNSDYDERPKITILLVDDSITVRQTLALTLQKAGYQVLQAKDGYEAIEQLRYHTNIQLVFCDIEMPRMNGFEFLKNRQRDRALADIPVVMVTSRSSEKHRLLASQLGANGYITKPYLEHMLLETLRDILEKNTEVAARRG